MLPGSKIQKLEKVASLVDAKVKGSLGGLAIASYNGPTCKILNQVSDVLLEVPFPKDACTPGSEMAKQKAQCKRVWEGLKSFLAEIAARFEYPPGCTKDQKQLIWNERADKVDVKGREFVEALKIVHPKNKSLYAHFASRHCGDQFRRHGWWPGYGMDGLEAKHAVTKLLQRRVSNSIPFQRLATVLSHYVMRDYVLDKAVVRTCTCINSLYSDVVICSSSCVCIHPTYYILRRTSSSSAQWSSSRLRRTGAQ